MLSVSFLSPVFRCGPKNGYFLGAVFWPPILARGGEAQLSGLTPVGQHLRPENGHCFGDRVWEAMFWTANPGPRAGLRLWFVFWTRFGCCFLLPLLCPICGLRLVLKLSCASVCGPFCSAKYLNEHSLFQWTHKQNTEKGLAPSYGALWRQYSLELKRQPSRLEEEPDAPPAKEKHQRQRMRRWSRRWRVVQGRYKAGLRLPLETLREKATVDSEYDPKNPHARQNLNQKW